MAEVQVQETPRRSNGGIIAVIVLLVIGLAVMAYFLSSKNKALNECTANSTELQSNIDGMNEMMSGYVDNMSNDLRKDFQNMLNTYDALKAKDATQADSINAQKAKIQGLMNQLSSNKKMTAQQLYALRKENETLRGIMKGYVKQIDSLNTLNLQLTSDLDVKTNELTMTAAERDQYKTEAEASAAQVKKGSRLQAYGFNSTGLRMKMNNTTEPTTKAKGTVQIKSSFTISENPITPAGPKTVYLQVIDPDGKTLQSRSGNTIQTESGNIAYSDKKDINYENQRIDVAIYYDMQGQDAVKGTYKVRIYCEGQLIGTDSFTLK